jgi:hypothetical protein
MRNEIGYGRTPEADARYIVRVPLPRDAPVPAKGRTRKGFVATAPAEEAKRRRFTPDPYSYRVRIPGEKVRYGPERGFPIR